MKIDLHVHTSEGSDCALSTLDEMAAAAKASGLDAMAVCNHARLLPAALVEETNRKFEPFRVFSGIEIDVGLEHILVLGLNDADLEWREWEWPGLHRFVREKEGFLVLAHPYRFTSPISVDLDRFRPDAIEVRSLNMDGCDPRRVEALAERLEAKKLTNSDAHTDQGVGVYYNQLDRPARDDAELVELLRSGSFLPGRMEERLVAYRSQGYY